MTSRRLLRQRARRRVGRRERFDGGEAAGDRLAGSLQLLLAAGAVRGVADQRHPRVRQAGQLRPQLERRPRLRRAVGHQQEAETGVGERVHAAHPDPGGVARAQGEAAGLVLRTPRLHQDEVAAERRGRGDRTDAAEPRQAQAESLERAVEAAVLHDRLAQKRPAERLGGGLHRHVLRPEQHLHAARAGQGRRPGAERKVHGAQAHAVRGHLADHQVGRAEEGRDELGLRVQVQLVRRADLQEPAKVHDADAVGEIERLLLVVGHEDGGDTEGALDGAHRAPQIDADAGVQRAERLVQQQDLGPVRQGARQGDALLLAAREFQREAPAQPGQTHHLEELVAPAPPRAPRHPADLQRELDVLRHRHVAEQRVVLEHHADAPRLRRLLGHIAPVKQDAPAFDVGEPRDQAQQSALAAAAGAEQDEELPVRHLEGHVVHHGVSLVALHQLFQDDRHGLATPR